jgi:hypothetical protein
VRQEEKQEEEEKPTNSSTIPLNPKKRVADNIQARY